MVVRDGVTTCWSYVGTDAPAPEDAYAISKWEAPDLSTFDPLRRLGQAMGQSARLFYVAKLA